MALEESQATEVLNIYLKFCQVLQSEGKVTDKNFNRIRTINGYIGGKQKSIKATWGNLFDEIYYVLADSEIKTRLEKEKREISLLRAKKKRERQKSLSDNKINNEVPSTELRKNSKLSKEQKEISKLKGNKSRQNLKNVQNNQSKKRQGNRLKQKRRIQGKSMEEIRKIFWISVEKAKQEEQTRKNAKYKSIYRPLKFVPPDVFDDGSSTFEDVMDERKAEGKGYGGAK